ncbi:MAG: sigma factor [Azospirillaceae bacterium]
MSHPIDRQGPERRGQRIPAHDLAGPADPPQLRDLFERWHSHTDVTAASRILNDHMPLVVAVAAEFEACGHDRQDLIGAGNAGLVRAMNRFDIDEGIGFANYARWWIRVAIRGHVLAGGPIEPVPDAAPRGPVMGVGHTALWG